MKQFIKGMYQKKYFWQRFIAMLLAIVTMGLTLSILVRVNLGTDPFTTMNLAASANLGISFGNWQAVLNTVLFIFILLWGRNYIGFGTIANMFLVGYVVDFFSWVWDNLFGTGNMQQLPLRVLVLIPTLAIFIVSAGVYMAMDLGTSPYDALPYLIQKKIGKLSFRVIRMAWDISFLLIGLAIGGTIGVVTIVMAFFLGPVIAWVEKKIKNKWEF